MPVRIRRPRASRKGRPPDGDEPPDNRLALLDQAFYSGHRAVGQRELMQVGWVYDHALDFDGLKRFHHNLARGLLGRLIERSPLPFGRYRWVLNPRPPEIDIAECARPRAEIGDWLDECSQVPIDPESGPGYRLSFLPFTDGATAVTLLISHNVLDGIGGVVAVAEAILGTKRDLGYPPPRSRTLPRAVVQDAARTARDAPEVARALVAAVKEARRRRHDVARAEAPRPVPVHADDADDPVVVPGVWIHIDSNDWEARAKALGGTSSSLAAGLTAKFGEHMGRRHGGDGDVKIQLLVNNRTQGDTRAVAVAFAPVSIDPTNVTTDLNDTRAAIKQALKTLRETPDQSSQLAPLTPFTPKRTWKQLIDYALDDPDHPAVCSHLGDIGSVVSQVDGTQCNYGYARGTSQHLTRRWLERMGGQLQLYIMYVPSLAEVSVSVLAYQLGGENTRPALRELAERTLAEFGLTGEID